MQITIDDLKKERDGLEAQRQNAIAVAQQAAGAIQLIDALIQRIEGGDEPESLSMEELAKEVGGVGATVDVQPVNGEAKGAD